MGFDWEVITPTDIRQKSLDSKYFDEEYFINNHIWIVPKKIVREGQEEIDETHIIGPHYLKVNSSQKVLLSENHTMIIIVKGRQMGITTLWIARCFFRAITIPHFAAGIIADTKKHAQEFLNAIRIMYDHLPPDLKSTLEITKNNTQEIGFSNGSSIQVSVSFVSGTLQWLHVTEFAKLAENNPKAANDILQGSKETIGMGNYFILECTSRGPGGLFQKVWDKAEIRPRDLLRFKRIFLPTYNHLEYRLPGEESDLSDEMRLYFDRLEHAIGHSLPVEYKIWYQSKLSTMTDKYQMFQEYPNTIDEAFEVDDEGRIFINYVRKAESDGRIGEIPVDVTMPVLVCMDLGFNDMNSLIFFQDYDDDWFRFIYGYQNNNQHISYYIRLMNQVAQENFWSISTVILPHDGNRNDVSQNLGSTAKQLHTHNYKVLIVKRPTRKIDSINDAKKIFHKCKFDKKMCKDFIDALKLYKRKLDMFGVPTDKPVHDQFSHYCDSFQGVAAYSEKKYDVYNTGMDEELESDSRYKELIRGGV